MLAFDIETKGLDFVNDPITVACVYDPVKRIKESFCFLDKNDSDAERDAKIDAFLKHLDDADVLCAFNGARFDIPFIIEKFKVPKERYTPWFEKLFDYFEICKLVFGSSCSLNNLLKANGWEQTKTASGAEAVEWANQERWDEIMDYCMMDTKLTYEISVKASVKLPLTKGPHAMCHNRFWGVFVEKGDDDDCAEQNGDDNGEEGEEERIMRECEENEEKERGTKRSSPPCDSSSSSSPPSKKKPKMKQVADYRGRMLTFELVD